MALIYVVEDDKNIREIEKIALQNSGHTVEEFECAKDFFEELKSRKPDLLLLDIMLPDADGLEMVQSIREDAAASRLPIIMVTAKTTEIDKVKGLDMGADDYLTKPFGVMELISRVKALLRRTGKEAAEKQLIIGNVCLNDEKHCVTVDGAVCELTYKEYELLKVLMINAGGVSTREEILDKVWGTDFEGESRTLDMHIKTLRHKLGESGSMIKTVRNVGYILNV
ncbi:MAG: response regulator transcription factor [Lachnospiraceae bacterium]|nr:response regulator transcription factor [Lachnospiraceae bacterium]